MQLCFGAMKLNHVSLPGVGGVLDSDAGTVSATCHKTAQPILDAYMSAEDIVIEVLSAAGVPVFLPKAKMESVRADNNAESLRVVFRFEPNCTTFKRPD